MKKKLPVVFPLFFLGTMLVFAQENLRHLAQWSRSDLMSKYSTPTLPHNQLLRMWQDQSGKLYLATIDGIVVVKRQKGTINQVTTIKMPGMQNVIWMGNQLVVAVDKKEIFLLKIDETQEKTVLDCPASLDKHFSLPLLAPLNERQFLLAARNGTIWLFDLNQRQGTKIPFNFRPGKFTMAQNPVSGTVFAVSDSKLFKWQDGNFALQAELPISECYSLSFSPRGDYLYFYQPLSAYEIATGKIISVADSKQLYRWGMAIDVKNNVLYCAGWDSLDAFWPADDPTKWRQINGMMVTDEMSLYTHRSLNPATNNGSVMYLQETDELLVACKLGVNVLTRNKSGANSLDVKNDWSQMQVDNQKLPGNGTWMNFLRQQKLSAAWVSSSAAITDESMDNYQRAGINALLYLCFQIDHGEFYPPHDVRKSVRKVSELCRDRGFKIVTAMTPYNISINNSDTNFRRMIIPDGEVARYIRPPSNEKYTNLEYPCYHDLDFAKRQGIIYQVQEFAKLASEGVIDGLCFELGDGFGGTNIRNRSLCFCDDCFAKFTGLQELPPAAERLRWLYRSERHKEYETFQEEALAAICQQAREVALSLAPEMELMVMLPEQTAPYQDSWFFNAFIRGFQFPGRPVTVFSEQTYGCPYMPQLVVEPVQAWQQKGWDTVLIPGLVNYWLSPEQLLQRSREYLQMSAGIYFYHGYRWYQEKLNETLQKPINKFDLRTPATLGEYIEAMSALKQKKK